MKVTIVERGTQGWGEAAGLAHDAYAGAFAADTQPNPDRFIVAWSNRTWRDTTGPAATHPVASACAGMTFASERPFFCEHYLDEPIEDLVVRVADDECDRRRIVEIGSLASRVPRAGHELIRVTPIVAWCLGMQLILCTATQRLRIALDQLGIAFRPLGPARRERLDPEEQHRWGRYYDDFPAVGVIALDDLSRLFADCTGRYAFDAVGLTLLSEAHPPAG
jgi:hypothetical protein